MTLSRNEGEEGRDYVQKNVERMERKNVYTNRLKKIQKICKKYGLSAADEGKIPITKAKLIQTEFSYSMIPPLSDKV